MTTEAETGATFLSILAIDPAAVAERRDDLRRAPRKDRAAAIRALLRDLGVKGVSVTTPSYAMASHVDVTIPEAPEHDRDDPALIDPNTGWHGLRLCPICRLAADARLHLREVIEAAFPGLDDRSDCATDYFDDPVHIR